MCPFKQKLSVCICSVRRRKKQILKTDLMALEMDVDSRDAGNIGNLGGLFREIVLLKRDIWLPIYNIQIAFSTAKFSLWRLSSAQPTGVRISPDEIKQEMGQAE